MKDKFLCRVGLLLAGIFLFFSFYPSSIVTDSSRRVKPIPANPEKEISIPSEYLGLVNSLNAENPNSRVEAIKEIVNKIKEEKDQKKRQALVLVLIEKFNDPQEIVREKTALSLRKVLPLFDEEFQKLVAIEIVNKLGAEEDYIRRSIVWGLKKIMPSLKQGVRLGVSLYLIDKWLYSSLPYLSFSALEALEKMIDYLNAESQKRVVEQLQLNLVSKEEGVRNITVKVFIGLIPLLKARVVEEMALDLKSILEKEGEGRKSTPQNIARLRAVAITIKAVIPYLKDHTSLKEELLEEIDRLVSQP